VKAKVEKQIIEHDSVHLSKKDTATKHDEQTARVKKDEQRNSYGEPTVIHRIKKIGGFPGMAMVFILILLIIYLRYRKRINAAVSQHWPWRGST
jgi:hypothetical protein